MPSAPLSSPPRPARWAAAEAKAEATVLVPAKACASDVAKAEAVLLANASATLAIVLGGGHRYCLFSKVKVKEGSCEE